MQVLAIAYYQSGMSIFDCAILEKRTYPCDLLLVLVWWETAVLGGWFGGKRP